jgi:ABC-2 type transport system permease protein
VKSAGLLLIKRGLIKLLTQPMAPLSGLGMSLFFLIVYTAGIGGIGFLPQFGEAGYFAFLFPLGVISLTMGSAGGAGQALYTDMQSGYFKRLYLSPAPRWSFVAAPLIADGVGVFVSTGILLVVGTFFGLPFRFGIWSIIGVLLISLMSGVMLSSLSAGIMLRTGNHQGAQMVTLAVFPLIFLSTTFLPRELINAQWLLAVSWGNPVTYIMEAMRFLLTGSASSIFFFTGLAFSVLGTGLALMFAISGSKKILV